jgi:hypothetical protein
MPTPNAAKTAWIETVLYSFCARGGSNCTDGANPEGLIRDAAGRLYGTTGDGGAHGGGTAFMLTPNAAKTAWIETVLYSFCGPNRNCPDGGNPLYGLLANDAAGRLYGTTAYGGALQGGTAFMLTPNAAKTAWTHTIIYSFEPFHGDSFGGLIRDAAGRLYGTALGGAHAWGMVFMLTPNAAKTAWIETVLYNFCARGGSNCTDGRLPVAGVIRDAAGHLYGTTQSGGIGFGTVFELR